MQNGEVSVRCKSISGEVDQACGLVWRYRDPNNYYITRANALENNVVIYKVQDGERRSLAPKAQPSRAYGVKHPVPSGQWNELRVKFQGSLMTVFLNGQQLFEVEDSTFGDAGKVGLWTKADSVTYLTTFGLAENDARPSNCGTRDDAERNDFGFFLAGAAAQTFSLWAAQS